MQNYELQFILYWQFSFLLVIRFKKFLYFLFAVTMNANFFFFFRLICFPFSNKQTFIRSDQESNIWLFVIRFLFGNLLDGKC